MDPTNQLSRPRLVQPVPALGARTSGLRHDLPQPARDTSARIPGFINDIVYIYIYVYICMYIHKHKHVDISIYIYIYVYVYVFSKTYWITYYM